MHFEEVQKKNKLYSSQLDRASDHFLSHHSNKKVLDFYRENQNLLTFNLRHCPYDNTIDLNLYERLRLPYRLGEFADVFDCALVLNHIINETTTDTFFYAILFVQYFIAAAVSPCYGCGFSCGGSNNLISYTTGTSYNFLTTEQQI